MAPTKNNARMVLHKLEFLVNLGWGQDERALQQMVTVDIHVQFANPPVACMSDNLSDTFCYDTLNKTIQDKIGQKEFRLLEYLAQEIYSCVKNFIIPNTTVNICVTKYPNHFFKSGGVSFWYGDTEREQQ